jgi:hypothetical protein
MAYMGAFVLGGCVSVLGWVLVERGMDNYKAQKYLANELRLQVMMLNERVTKVEVALRAVKKEDVA